MSKLVVGAHVVCLFNGRLMGQVTAMDWSISSNRTRRHGLDGLMPYEISVGNTWIQGSVSILRVHGDAGLEGRGIVAPAELLPREKYFSILLIDRSTGTKLLQADHCMVTGQKWAVQAKQRLTGSFAFEGIDYANELKF